MAFSTNTKVKAKSKSNYTCCWCRTPGTPVHVHHILPQADGGSDALENAAVLCPTCHAAYGHNPEYRGQVRERRDDWDSRLAEQSVLVDPLVQQKLDRIIARLDALESQNQLTNQDYREAIDASSSLLPANTLTPAAAATTGVVVSATASIFADYSAYITRAGTPIVCPSCGEKFWSPALDGTTGCPHCGVGIYPLR